MKRFLTVFPAVLCLILSLCVPIGVSADESETYPEPRSLQDWINRDCDGIMPKYYFHAVYRELGGTFNNPQYYSYEYFFYIDKEDFTVETNNDIVTVTFDSSQNFFFRQQNQRGSIQWSDSNLFTVLTYNLNTEELSFNCGFIHPESFGNQYILDTNVFSVLPSSPSVIVSFEPVLKGDVDRNVSNSNGTKSLLQDLQMKVENFSPYPIQYKMQIKVANPVTHRLYKPDSDTWLTDHYDDDPVFIYYSNGQVYDHISKDYRDDGDPDGVILLYHKATEWHKVNSNDSVTVTIPFSMINLKENVDYIIEVEAYRLDYDFPSNCFRSSNVMRDFCINADHYILAYSETFKMLQYSDISYNSNLTFGDVLSYNGDAGYSDLFKYNYNYDAVTDGSGYTDIGHYDIFKDPDSWYNTGSFLPSSNFSDLSKGLSVKSFSGMFSNVFGFVSAFFNYLPSSMAQVYIFGFSCLVVVAIIKAVR